MGLTDDKTMVNGDTPKELDKNGRRTKAAEEILSTEVSYCNGLDLLVEHFIQPMKIYGILSMDEIDVIFSNIESLHGLSKEMVSKLKLRLENWEVESTIIGDVLVEMFSYLKMFKPYFDSRSAANQLRIRYEKSNDRFRNFLSRVNCGQTLDSLLLMPIQRIPRYQLLLKELVKRTEPEHPDFENLTEALAKAQETATDLNEHIRQIENESKIFEIINMFPNDDLDLIISDSNNSPKMKPS
ncbi:domain containing, partial [Paramuricea clavata]